MKKHNFNAGPSILPREVIEKTAQAILDFNGSGLSLMEISHRAKDFQPVVDEAVALFKELLNIPEGYSVLFLGGGASLEFCMVPFNFLEKKAAYLNTGVWAKKAIKEAKAFGEVVEVASSAEAPYTYIPKHYTYTLLPQKMPLLRKQRIRISRKIILFLPMRITSMSPPIIQFMVRSFMRIWTLRFL